MTLITVLLALATASSVSAQYGTGEYGPYGPGGRFSPDHFGPGGFESGGGNNAPSGSSRGRPSQAFMDHSQKMIVAHGILASLAFVILFPVGAIAIRLGSFRGAWLIHGLFQLFAYIVYTAAFGLGVWIVTNMPINLLGEAHPTIGILVFVLLFFQPILGFIHHLQFKKYSRRTVWSYGHLWLGRIVITLGIINGGLGLLLASNAPAFTGFQPSQGHFIAYGVVAGIMWLLWVVAAVIGERRRAVQKEVSRKEINDSPRHSKEVYK